MKLQIDYQELESIIREKTQQSVTFKYVDDKTVVLSKEIKVLLVRKRVDVNLTVLRMQGTDLTLSYHAGLGLELLAKGMMTFFKDMLGNIVEDKGANVLLVHLNNVEKLQKPLSVVDISDVHFNPQAVDVGFSLK